MISQTRPLTLALALAAGSALTTALLFVGAAEAEEPPPVDQADLAAMVADDPQGAFLWAFEAGDELTEAVFSFARGVGAKVDDARRFTRLPRADLSDEGEWALHEPMREGGPQAQSCITCHSAPLANGAGALALNVAIDPLHSGDPAQFLERNTLHLFALGGPQRAAEEMTAALMEIETTLGETVCTDGAPAETALTAKGVSFGVLAARPDGTGTACTPIYDRTGIEGIDDDLVVRIFGWKGTHASIREFLRGAAHNEMGMQAVELVGKRDGDYDGVTEELTVGDMTAMAIYMAALERPTSKLELAELGLYELDAAARAEIIAGEAVFEEIGCNSCHVKAIEITDPVFTEPSRQAGFLETVFPSGDDPAEHGLTPENAITFDLTADQPNNRIETKSGEVRLGAFEKSESGGAILNWYTDFKRHPMGEELADPIDAYGFGADVWPTRSLAGVGSTGPWLHDGRAVDLESAILAHGGAAENEKQAYEALDQEKRAAVISFLENLVIANFDEEEEH